MEDPNGFRSKKSTNNYKETAVLKIQKIKRLLGINDVLFKIFKILKLRLKIFASIVS
jgi:hypothetical protein